MRLNIWKERIMDKIEELENKIKELSEEIERLKAEKEKEVWKPKCGDKYWLISHNGYVVQVRWMGDEAEDDIYAIGNVFRTQEEAEFRVEQLKVEAELRRFARPFEENKSNWTMIYEADHKKIATYNYTSFQIHNIHFASEEIAQKAIDTVGEDRIKKYYFGVEE